MLPLPQRRSRVWLPILIPGALLFDSAHATVPTAVFCAHTPAELQADLTTAQADGMHDIVYVVTGNYSLTSGLTFNSSEGLDLTITGGVDDATCTSTAVDLAGPGSVLDGQHSVRPLYISNPGGSVGLYALTIAAGSSTNGSGGAGVQVAGCNSCGFYYLRFYGNHASGGTAPGGALLANGTGGVIFINNLVLGSHGVGAGGVVLNFGSGTGIVYNNTIVYNTTDTLSDPGGLLLETGGSANFLVANNIIWGNAAVGGSDFKVVGVNTRNTNDIGAVASGSTAGTVTGDMSVDPQFESCPFLCIDYELKYGSPLIDAGTPTNGLPYEDLLGLPRPLGPQLDIGAYENDAIFIDGFGS